MVLTLLSISLNIILAYVLIKSKKDNDKELLAKEETISELNSELEDYSKEHDELIKKIVTLESAPKTVPKTSKISKTRKKRSSDY